MQIEDNILLKVEETDIDENGKCIIPNGVKQIAENAINSDKIKELILPEGVIIIENEGICCLNLEQIEFPSTLEKLGGISAIYSKKLIPENIKFKNYICTLAPDCFGDKKLLFSYCDYQSKIISDKIETILSNKNLNNIDEILNNVENIVNIYEHILPCLINQEQQKELNQKLVQILSQKINNKELGQIFLENTLNNNKKITPSLMLYYYEKEIQKQGVQNPLVFSLINAKVASANIDGSINIGLESLTSNIKRKTIKGFIPKFKFEYDLDLKEDLKKLGLEHIFEQENAGLELISEKEDVYIYDAIHKAVIEFTQDGIKAAAKTDFGSGGGGDGFDYIYEVPVEEIDLTFNKPYMFLIRDKETGEVWFVGTVYKPLLWENENTQSY